MECDATKKATIKKYVPKLQSNGVSVQSELREEETTRKGLMEHMQGAFAECVITGRAACVVQNEVGVCYQGGSERGKAQWWRLQRRAKQTVDLG